MTIPQHYSGIGQYFLLLFYRSTVWNTTNTKAIYAFQCSMPFCFIKPNHTHNYPVATLLSDLKGTCAGFASFYPLGCKYHDPNRKCYLKSTRSIEICLCPLRLNCTPKMSRVSKNSKWPRAGSTARFRCRRWSCTQTSTYAGSLTSAMPFWERHHWIFFHVVWDRPSYELLYVAKV